MTTLAERMKHYEEVSDNKLTRRLPIILRVDGNSFHAFTKAAKFKRPFDKDLSEMMLDTAINILRYCSGSIMAYVQSDEISVLLRNDQTIRTNPFLANRVQKLTSLVASKATVSFHKTFLEWAGSEHVKALANDVREEIPLYAKRKDLTPTFDCRAFVLPPAEVTNYFIWRQLDAYKNGVSSAAEHVLAKKFDKSRARQMLHGKTTGDRVELLAHYGFYVQDALDPRWLDGVAIRKMQVTRQLGDILAGKTISKDFDPEEEVTRSMWVADYKTPVFKDNRDYIEGLL